MIEEKKGRVIQVRRPESGEDSSFDLTGIAVPLESGVKYIPRLGPVPEDLFEPSLSLNALTVLRKRYLQKDLKGEVVETPKEMFWRIAATIALNEPRYNVHADPQEWARIYYRLMASLDFLPNSPTLMNAGRPLGQLAACFVLPVEDSLEGIFEAIKRAALVHQSGGGTGFSFSRLRPKGSAVASTSGIASGPVSFMAVFNAATEAIKQGGTRRGANMGILRVDHPDIREFITCKRDMVSITNFNISVAVTDRFMEAVEKDERYDLIAPHTGEVVAQEDAREIFNLIAENAWLNGDPGLVFINEINRKEKTPHIGLVEATNPCGEQPLLPYESCNLGSVNLDKMLRRGPDGRYQIDWEHLRETVRLGVRFLDNIVDLNRFPIPEIKAMTQGNRRIGLGVMGFADMLYALRIPYNSEEAIQLGGELMRFIHTEARQMSDELAEERGPFPNWEGSVFTHPTRNSTVTTIAPTGTISMIADTSGGIEPNFALCYVKRVMDDDRLLYVNNRLREIAQEEGWFSEELMEKIAEGASLSQLPQVPEYVRKVFVTAHDISPEWHVRMQAAFQEWTDNAVSKTINFPHSASVEDVKNAYMLAWKLKCKGITIYRDGSRSVQVMNVGDKLARKSEVEMVEVEPSEAARIGVGWPTEPVVPYRLKPRHRPRITRGYTEQIRTGEGTLYVTINEDEFGLCEVFASIGKVGGSAMAHAEAIGRLISLALRSGVDPHAIVTQLKGITGPNPVRFEGQLVRSVPDAIAQALERYLKSKESQQQTLPLEIKEEIPPEVQELLKPPIYDNGNYQDEYVRATCPDCNSPLSLEEGCLICRFCGYSKCD